MLVKEFKTFRSLACVTSLLITGCTVFADAAPVQAGWQVRKIDPSSMPRDVVTETRRRAPNGLPDGLVATHTGGGDIASAWYAAPTTRYRHAILGDAIEAGVLKVKTKAGDVLSLTLPKRYVFEDRYPRLADLDRDGKIEVITIRSSTASGGSVTVYGLQGGKLVQRATTGFIGRTNRWLNIAGIAPFLGGKAKQIAYVQTPHIGGTLFFYAFRNGGLKRVGSVEGFSNHEIGSREMRLSAVADVDGDGRVDLAVPSHSRSRLRIIGFGTKGPRSIASIKLPGRIDKAIAVDGSGPSVKFTVGLADGSLYEITR